MSVEIHVNGLRTTGAPNQSLFDCAEHAGVTVPTSCRKQGKCKECVVEVVEGIDNLSPATDAERHLKPPFRLSCCARIAGESGVVRFHTMRRGEMRIEKEAYSLPIQGRPWKLESPITREGDMILMDGKEIAQSRGPVLGLAVDLGTTTIVLRLLNLITGELIADSSFENPQRFGGSDVMARIQFDTDDHTRTLQRTLVGYLGRAIQELPADPQSIFEIVIAGNSTMRDIFFRLSVHSIGQSPYRSITELELESGKRTSTSLAVPARNLGISVHPKARVYGLPIISGHVGADAAACMLAVDLSNEDRTIAIMDIGTNTELIVGNRHKILAASCPAGPAFEGGQVSFGMPGLPGAIERVIVTGDGQFETSVIGGGPAEGICGSGLVDLLGELVRTGRMNRLGRFESGPAELVIDTSGDRPVTFSEADVNALAQAKGANAAGLQIAFREFGVRHSDLDVFYLAGGFGRHLNIESSRRIGLIPNVDSSRIVQVGNASLEGACVALLSGSKRKELEDLVRRVTHCRLETHPDFFDIFVEGCQFAPVVDAAAAPKL